MNESMKQANANKAFDKAARSYLKQSWKLNDGRKLRPTQIKNGTLKMKWIKGKPSYPGAISTFVKVNIDGKQKVFCVRFSDVTDLCGKLTVL